jgi:hypothetical protein
MWGLGVSKWARRSTSGSFVMDIAIRCSRSMQQAIDNFTRRASMTRRQKDPLRPLTEEECFEGGEQEGT